LLPENVKESDIINSLLVKQFDRLKQIYSGLVKKVAEHIIF